MYYVTSQPVVPLVMTKCTILDSQHQLSKLNTRTILNTTRVVIVTAVNPWLNLFVQLYGIENM